MKASEKFPTVQELIDDEKFPHFIRVRITEIFNHRNEVLSKSRPGAYLKKGPYDYLEEHELLNPDSLRKEFILINNKTSSLPANVRDYVFQICIIAIRSTINYYDAIDKKQKELNTIKVGDKKHKKAKMITLNASVKP